MPACRSFLTLVVAALFGLGWSARACADVPTNPSVGLREPLRVRVEGAARCFTDEQLWREVAARTPRVRHAADFERSRTVVVKLREEDHAIAGTLILEDGTEQTEPRNVRADTCEGSLSAFALIAALSVDPNAETKPTVPAHAISPGPAAARPVTPAPTPPPPPPALHRDETPHANGPRAPSGAAPRLSFVPLNRWVYAAGLGGEALAPNGLGNPFVFAPRAVAEMARTLPGVFSPSLRLSAEWAAIGSVTTVAGTAHPALWTTDLDFCPLRFVSRLIATCADVEVGALSVAASGKETHGATEGWVAPGLSARIEWPTFTFGDGAQLFIDFAGGARTPLVRKQFEFIENGVDLPVYRAPSAVPHGDFTLVVRFW